MENDKLDNLHTLLDTYMKFIKKWDTFSIIKKGGIIHIVWQRIKTEKDDTGEKIHYLDYTIRTFAEGDLDKKIASYKNKINREQANGG